jgi:hypothetical protein
VHGIHHFGTTSELRRGEGDDTFQDKYPHEESNEEAHRSNPKAHAASNEKTYQAARPD